MIALRAFLALIVVFACLLVGGLFSVHPPLGRSFATPLLIAFGMGGLISAVLILRRNRGGIAIAAMIIAIGAVQWFTLKPSNDRPWSRDVVLPPTGVFDGNRLTLSNLRNFRWNLDNTIAEERWETLSYDLAKLRSVDLYLNHWMGEHIAHTLLSFGFEDGRYLAWSIEVRNLDGQSFDAVSGFFRSNELVHVAGDERDIVRRRTHATREDVRIYRLALSHDLARRLLESYVTDANSLAREPAFYNTLTTNCTTVIIKLARALGVTIPADWRFLANGHLPSYLHERGALVPGYSLDQLTAAGKISARALALPENADFSRGIRAGVPGMGR
jgi:Domain of unknown function (DUF4105)